MKPILPSAELFRRRLRTQGERNKQRVVLISEALLAALRKKLGAKKEFTPETAYN
jgi:hypothetical protein